jgi:hypothetical protein
LSGWSRFHYQRSPFSLVPAPTPLVGMEQRLAINLRSTPTRRLLKK